jgi:RNA polymerase sigma-70 factor (ECF subfamily)
VEPEFEHAHWRGLKDLEPVLRGYLARRCRDENEIDDVIQETFLRAARYRSSLADPLRLRGWALRIASNVLNDHARREARSRSCELAETWLDALEGRESDPSGADDEPILALGDAVFARESLLGQLEVALNGLRHSDRRVLESYYAGGQSCAATAVECGIPPPLVKVRLFRARRRLGRALRTRLGAAAPPGGDRQAGRGVRCGLC